MSGCTQTCNQGRTCTCASEAGNYYPPVPDEISLTPLEAIVIYGGLVAASIVGVGVLAFCVGFVYQLAFGG